MYPPTLQVLLPLLVALNNTRNADRSQTGYSIGPSVPSGYSTESSYPSGYNIESSHPSEYNTEPSYPSGYTAHQHVLDITEVCDNVECGDRTCNVIVEDKGSPPVPICGDASENPVVPRDANAACRVNGYISAVLTGDISSFLPLEPFPCVTYDDCPYGSICINSVCCFGRPNCTETVNRLFQASFEFEGTTYAVSSDIIANDVHASAICVAQGGYLAQIESAEEDSAIRAFLMNANLGTGIQGVRIAGREMGVDEEFFYQYTGTQAFFFNWAANQPNFPGTADCLRLLRTDSFLFDDTSCNMAVNLFLCEFPEVAEKNKKRGYNSKSHNFLNGYIDGTHFSSGYNAEPQFPSGYNDELYFLSGYNAEPYFPSGYSAGSHFQSGYNTRSHSHGRYIAHNSKADITSMCDNVLCGDRDCSVVVQDKDSYPVPICSSPDRVREDANAGCRVAGLTSAVLMGEPAGISPLQVLKCVNCDDCPYGTICVNGACCFGRPNCTETLNKLFQASFEFNNRVYALSENVEAIVHSQAICEALGGYLAEIETSNENDAIVNFLMGITFPRNIAGVYIGGTDAEVEGQFVFPFTGRDVVYFNFDAGQPTELGFEDCLHLEVATSFQWGDVSCVTSNQLFLCEFPEVPMMDKKKNYNPYYP